MNSNSFPYEINSNDWNFLRRKKPFAEYIPTANASFIDLYAGAGLLSLGLREALTDKNINSQLAFACEIDKYASYILETNLKPEILLTDSIKRANTSKIIKNINKKDFTVLLAGPPCQGHSDLNNYSRREDPRNSLINEIIPYADLIRPELIIVENVTNMRNDRTGSISKYQNSIASLGYKTEWIDTNSIDYGVPQSRKRSFIISTCSAKQRRTSVKELLNFFKSGKPRPIRWALEDINDDKLENTSKEYTTARIKPRTKDRIDYLFENNVYDLPDIMRPKCHQDGKHSYKSIYGRLHWDKPSQTITCGFLSMCMGRYIHPSKRRTINPREAARIQTIPDYFDISGIPRMKMAMIIGNAVPVKLGYAVARASLYKAGITSDL